MQVSQVDLDFFCFFVNWFFLYIILLSCWFKIVFYNFYFYYYFGVILSQYPSLTGKLRPTQKKKFNLILLFNLWHLVFVITFFFSFFFLCCCFGFFESIRHGFLLGCFHEEKKIPSLYHGLGPDRGEGHWFMNHKIHNDLCWPMILNKAWSLKKRE